MKNKGSLKLSVRDITYFQNYSGYSTFQNSHEPFTIQWDSRVVRMSFSWRFGKAMKAVSRSEGGATDEINRAGKGIRHGAFCNVSLIFPCSYVSFFSFSATYPLSKRSLLRVVLGEVCDFATSKRSFQLQLKTSHFIVASAT